jgi:hypothetical protein
VALDKYFNPVGSGAETTTFVKSSGPPLVIVTVMTTGSPILVVGLSNDTAISAPAKTASAVEKISKKLIAIEIIIFLLSI